MYLEAGFHLQSPFPFPPSTPRHTVSPPYLYPEHYSSLSLGLENPSLSGTQEHFHVYSQEIPRHPFFPFLWGHFSPHHLLHLGLLDVPALPDLPLPGPGLPTHLLTPCSAQSPGKGGLAPPFAKTSGLQSLALAGQKQTNKLFVNKECKKQKGELQAGCLSLSLAP